MDPKEAKKLKNKSEAEKSGSKPTDHKSSKGKGSEKETKQIRASSPKPASSPESGPMLMTEDFQNQLATMIKTVVASQLATPPPQLDWDITDVTIPQCSGDLDTEPGEIVGGSGCDVDNLMDQLCEPPTAAQDTDADDILDEIAGFINNEESGPAISEKLANICNSLYSSRMSANKLKELRDKHKIPQNVNINTAKCNPEIWPRLRQATKTGDVRLQRVAGNLVKATAPLIALIEQLTQDAPDIGVSKRLALDTLMLLGDASMDLNQKRRDAIKPELNAKYRAICHTVEKEGALLFGEDLAARVKSVNDAANIGSRATSFQQRHFGFQNQYQYRGRRGAFNGPYRGRVTATTTRRHTPYSYSSANHNRGTMNQGQQRKMKQ